MVQMVQMVSHLDFILESYRAANLVNKKGVKWKFHFAPSTISQTNRFNEVLKWHKLIVWSAICQKKIFEMLKWHSKIVKGENMYIRLDLLIMELISTKYKKKNQPFTPSEGKPVL